MKEIDITPKYYYKFKCIGSKCHNTCCKDWQIDVDEDSLHKYAAIEDKDFSSFILDNISYDNKICLNKNVCPFLDDNCLCSIQKRYGESYLCNVCSKYPRITLKCDNITRKDIIMSCTATYNIIKKYHNQNKYLKSLIKLDIDTNTKQIIKKCKKINLSSSKNTSLIVKKLFNYLKLIEQKKLEANNLTTNSKVKTTSNNTKQSKINNFIGFYKKLEDVFDLLHFRNPIMLKIKKIKFFQTFNNFSKTQQKEILTEFKIFNKKNKKNLYPLFNYFINHYTFNHLTNGMFVKNLQKSIVIFYLIKLTLFKFYLKDKQFFNRNFLTFTSSFSRAIEHTQSIEVIEENMAEIFSEYN